MQKTERKVVRPQNTGKRYAAVIVNVRKTQRNEPCPCGSGEKFKKCCLNKEAAPTNGE